MASSNQQNSFQFEMYNALLKGANTGLKLYLAEQLLSDASAVMTRFKSPLAKDMIDIVAEISNLRAENKKYLATRDNRGPKEIEPAQQTNSADYGKVDATA